MKQLAKATFREIESASLPAKQSITILSTTQAYPSFKKEWQHFNPLKKANNILKQQKAAHQIIRP